MKTSDKLEVLDIIKEYLTVEVNTSWGEKRVQIKLDGKVISEDVIEFDRG
jgi:hypothetical protein